jgi:hypothetical protein
MKKKKEQRLTQLLCAGDEIVISIRDTHFVVEDGVSLVDSWARPVTQMLHSHMQPEGGWRYVGGGASNRPSVSDPQWGTCVDPMDRLTVELVWCALIYYMFFIGAVLMLYCCFTTGIKVQILTGA